MRGCEEREEEERQETRREERRREWKKDAEEEWGEKEKEKKVRRVSGFEKRQLLLAEFLTSLKKSLVRSSN